MNSGNRSAKGVQAQRTDNRVPAMRGRGESVAFSPACLTP